MRYYDSGIQKEAIFLTKHIIGSTLVEIQFIFFNSRPQPKIYCYNRVDQRSFDKILQEKPYFWSFQHNKKYFDRILQQKPQFWLFLQNQKCFDKILQEKPQFWSFLQNQKYFDKILQEKSQFCYILTLRPRGFRHCRAPSWFLQEGPKVGLFLQNLVKTALIYFVVTIYLGLRPRIKIKTKPHITGCIPVH